MFFFFFGFFGAEVNVRDVNARSASAENDAVAMSLILALTSGGGLAASRSLSRCLSLSRFSVLGGSNIFYTKKNINFR